MMWYFNVDIHAFSHTGSGSALNMLKGMLGY